MQKFMCVCVSYTQKRCESILQLLRTTLRDRIGVGKKRERNLLYFVLQTTVNFLKYSFLHDARNWFKWCIHETQIKLDCS